MGLTGDAAVEQQEAWQRLNDEIITCRTCPRLVAWREEVARTKRRAYRDWDYWGRPVPGFGDPQARLLLVGLAPGAHGANRTGRMFSGDSSGGTLYGSLYRTGFANRPQASHRGDGLKLTDAFITAVARCAPPGNRPTAAELAACRLFLEREWALLDRIEVVVALGQLAFEGCQRLLRDRGYQVPRLKFGHGAHYRIGGLHLLAAYHPSQQNTQTGRLTPAMLDEVFLLAQSLLTDGDRPEAPDSGPPPVDRRIAMINIRHGTIQDSKLLAEIGAETFYDSFAADNTPENMAAYLSASFNQERQSSELADSQSRFLIAEIDGQVVGYTHLKFTVAPQEIVGQKPMEIARFYSRKPWIGEGVGAQLMERCLQEARTAGCDVVWLDVWEKNPRAIAFYRKWGFVEVGKQTFRLGDEVQQDLMMARSVEERDSLMPAG